MEIQFTILGNPKAQKRHRTYTRGKGGKLLPFARNVDPSKTDKADMLAQIMQYAPKAPWTGPVRMMVMWYIPRPQSHYRTGKYAGYLRDDAPIYCDKKPDIDNYMKALLDCMNGVFFMDDCQVVRIDATKMYVDLNGRPGTNVVMSQL